MVPAALHAVRLVRSLLLAVALAVPQGAWANEDLRRVLFGSLEAGLSTFAGGGAKLALDRIDREGFVALVSGGTGIRPEGGSGGAPVLVRTTLIGAAVGGYQILRDWGVVAVYAGPEGAMDVLAGAGRFRALPARVGLRLQGEVWARPTEESLLTATLVLGSARGDAYARLSWGMALWGGYVGPEAGFYGDRTDYRKLTFGLHATDYPVGPLRIRVSAGGLYESGIETLSPYATLTLWGDL